MNKPWSCQRDGACCREPEAVTMTHAERDELLKAAPGVPLMFSPDDDPRFVRLQARPCPLLSEDGLCSVYEVRPYNCRRMACGREDVSSEPFEDGIPARFFTDRDFRRQMVLMQRRAQKWALSHGWES